MTERERWYSWALLIAFLLFGAGYVINLAAEAGEDSRRVRYEIERGRVR